ncbi:hypothetical protein [Kribbella flavida]|uniref:hypothetical protein n=1 Tax=Kribbella flavida TaxID=182640 RepID=UPI00019BF466|nr:hypothetical protein [Kribbella flavida]
MSPNIQVVVIGGGCAGVMAANRLTQRASWRVVTRSPATTSSTPSAAAVPTPLWTAGFSVPDLAARSGLSTDAIGRLLTDETLTSVDDDRIVATGDPAAPTTH